MLSKINLIISKNFPKSCLAIFIIKLKIFLLYITISFLKILRKFSEIWAKIFTKKYFLQKLVMVKGWKQPKYLTIE